MKLGYHIVVVAMRDVEVIVVVTFANVNVIVKVCGPKVGKVLVCEVITVIANGASAGACAGTRRPSMARVTQTTTIVLPMFCLFKTVLSRSWA